MNRGFIRHQGLSPSSSFDCSWNHDDIGPSTLGLPDPPPQRNSAAYHFFHGPKFKGGPANFFPAVKMHAQGGITFPRPTHAIVPQSFPMGWTSYLGQGQLSLRGEGALAGGGGKSLSGRTEGFLPEQVQFQRAVTNIVIFFAPKGGTVLPSTPIWAFFHSRCF